MSERTPSSGNGSRPPLTVYDLNAPVVRGSQWRRIPALALDALRVVWRASRRHFLLTTAFQALSAVLLGAQLLVAREILGGLIEVGSGQAPLSSLAPEFGLLVLVMVGMGALGALASREQRLLAELVARQTFDRIIGVSTAVDLASFETPEFYDQLQRARTSGLNRTVEVVNALTSLTTAALTSLGIAGVLLFLEPLLVALVALAAIPVLLSTLYNSRQAYTFEYAMTPESRERYYLFELLTGRHTAKEVRVFGADPLLRGRYNVLTDERIRRFRDFLRQRLKVEMVGTVAGALATAIALAMLAVFLVDGRIPVETALTAGLAMQQLASRLRTMTVSIGSLVESSMFFDDYNAFLALAPEAEEERSRSLERTATSAPRRFEGLSVEAASFVYPNTEALVLDNVSLEIGPGEVVALVGPNGSGKTTLVKLICQLYRPKAGRILWNGVDTETLRPEQIRADMTVIFQDFIQYHLSALDNIALGRVERPPELADVAAAAKQAGADEFVSRLPQGYETRLGRQFLGGYELSVGQWQRLALARAFFRGGDFLILDEPTASLDPKAEHELFTQMRSLSAGRAVLLVSHRFSSVRAADRIYVLDEGRVTEQGSHPELMARDGQYAELFRLQAAAYLGDDVRP